MKNIFPGLAIITFTTNLFSERKISKFKSDLSLCIILA